jgi:hypothetical protein
VKKLLIFVFMFTCVIPTTWAKIDYNIPYYETRKCCFCPEHKFVGSDMIQIQSNSINFLNINQASAMWTTNEFDVTFEKTANLNEFNIKGLKSGLLNKGERLLLVIEGDKKQLVLYNGNVKVRAVNLILISIEKSSIELPKF